MSLLNRELVVKAFIDIRDIHNRVMADFGACADLGCRECKGSGLSSSDGFIETGESRYFHAARWKARVINLCSCVDRSRLTEEAYSYAAMCLPSKHAV